MIVSINFASKICFANSSATFSSPKRFVSNKVLTTTRNGILSQTYNAQLMGAESKQLKPENLKTLGKKILIGENSENTVLTNLPEE